MPDATPPPATVTALHIAPVKGLASVPRQRVSLEEQGVAEDRRLFLVRPSGAVATLRQLPALAGVVPELDLAAGTLRATLPDGAGSLTVLGATAEPVEAELWGKPRTGLRLPGAVEDAIRSVAGEELRLVLCDRTGVGWDEGGVSLVALASARAVGA